MKRVAHMLRLAVLAFVGIVVTSCTTINVDYTITDVKLEQVNFVPEGDYSALTTDRKFYVMSASIKPVHRKTITAASIRPFPEGCANVIKSIDFTNTEHRNVNDMLGSMPILDGRCKDMRMKPESRFPMGVCHYDNVASIIEALQRGHEPRFEFLLSVPKDAPSPVAVTIEMDDKTVTSTNCGQIDGVQISGINYITSTGTEKEVPLSSVPVKHQEPSSAKGSVVTDVSAAAARMYAELCANPQLHEGVYTKATERFCTKDFQSLLKKALEAWPDDEIGPIDYDYWFMTQDDVQASFELGDVTVLSSTSATVCVYLKDDGQTYNDIVLVMQLRDGKWLVNDFVTDGPSGTVSIVKILNDYIRGEGR